MFARRRRGRHDLGRVPLGHRRRSHARRTPRPCERRGDRGVCRRAGVGDVEAGVVGGLVGLPFAIVSGGLACVAGAAVFVVAVPSFARYVRPSAGELISG